MLHRIVLTAVLSALIREAGVMETTEFAEAFCRKQQELRRNKHGAVSRMELQREEFGIAKVH